MKTIKSILFLLCIFFPVVGILGFGLDYFTHIHIIYTYFFWFWLSLFLIALIVFFREKHRFWIMLLAGVVFISIDLYSLFTHTIYVHAKIENSTYHVEVQRYSYKVTEEYYFFKRTIAGKQSAAFAADNVKIGIVLFPKVKLLNETGEQLILKIQPNFMTDTLLKFGAWK